MSRRRRRESNFAIARKDVRLLHLKTVDLVSAGDTLRFTYKERVFDARVSVDGYIATPTHAAHRDAVRRDATTSFYRLPSKFTNDCVAVYWADAGTATSADAECRTNPSGYERVRHVASGKSLNDLRNEFMRRFTDMSPPSSPDTAASSSSSTSSDDDTPATSLLADEPRYPDELAADIIARARARAEKAEPAAVAAKRARTSRPSPEILGRDVTRVLSDGAISIATLQAQSSATYKEIATALQEKIADHRAVLLMVLEQAESLVFEQQSKAPTNASAVASMLRTAINSIAAATQPSSAQPSSSSASSSASSQHVPAVTASELDSLMNGALM